MVLYIAWIVMCQRDSSAGMCRFVRVHADSGASTMRRVQVVAVNSPGLVAFMATTLLLLCAFAIPEVTALVAAAVMRPEAALSVKHFTDGMRNFSINFSGRVVGLLILIIPWVNMVWHEAMMAFHQPSAVVHRFLTGFAIYLALMCNGYFLLSVFREPGFVPLESLPDTEGGRRGDQEGVMGVRWCAKCQGVKPDGTHHCSVCKRCVIGMDHHCPFTTNCVGHENKHFFLWAGFFGCVGCFYAMVVSWQPFDSCIWHAAEMLMPDTVEACSRLEHEALLFVVAAIGFTSGLSFAMWHLWNAAVGETTLMRYQRVFKGSFETNVGTQGLSKISLATAVANVQRAFKLHRAPLWHALLLYPMAQAGPVPAG